MAAKPSLRAVKSDESAAPKPPRSRTVADAAANGTHRDLLVAMRDRIARAASDPDCPARDLAALTRRLQDIAKEIGMIDLRAQQQSEEDGSVGDEPFDPSAI